MSERREMQECEMMMISHLPWMVSDGLAGVGVAVPIIIGF